MPSPVRGAGDMAVNRTDRTPAFVWGICFCGNTFKKQTNTSPLFVLISARKKRNKEPGWRALPAASAGAARKGLSAEVTFELRTEWPEESAHTVRLRQRNHTGGRKWQRPSEGDGILLGKVHSTEL